ncbi:hypothetical protein BKA62DRAFT_741077 [Auriculariales sp. MPI-PUGE-AT-0066]|nr:hypothetical protein BKA62DRAFT_741077 [Auriculariales sp. MPI-PUGE-AT-0066]
MVSFSSYLAFAGAISACIEFTASVAAASSNVAGITLSSPGSGTIQVGPEPLDLFFRFCKPQHLSKRNKTVQILGHGATYTHDYWNFRYKPKLYSYERAALAAGYYPSPFDVVQTPLNIKIAAKIIKAVRNNTLGHSKHRLGRFDKIVYVGHSMGSVILNGVMANEPELVDVAVLTGYAHVPLRIPTIAGGELQIAANAFPAQFGNLDHGYTVFTSRSLFYGPPGSYDEAALQHDIATQNILSISDAFTLSLGVIAAPKYRGHVLAVNGEEDFLFCVRAGCANLYDEGRSFYPAAASFEAQVVPNTGHSLNMHRSSVSTYALIMAWLEQKGM